MDNLTHSLVGWALGQTGLKRKSRKGLAALILGANLPDIDVFFGWVSWVPLATHRGATHSLFGFLLLPPLLAGLLWLLDRWQIRRGVQFSSGLDMRAGWLLMLCYIGAATHPLLDLQTIYSVQLLSPTDHRWFHSDSLFIIDVWLLSGLALAIGLSRRRERTGGTWRKPAVTALLAGIAYIALNLGISAQARHALAVNAPNVTPDRVFADPHPVFFWRRRLVWRLDGQIGRAEYDPLKRFFAVSEIQGPWPDNMDDPRVRRARRANGDMLRFLQWSTMSIASIEWQGCTAVVTIADARYPTSLTGARFARSVTLPDACSQSEMKQ